MKSENEKLQFSLENRFLRCAEVSVDPWKGFTRLLCFLGLSLSLCPGPESHGLETSSARRRAALLRQGAGEETLKPAASRSKLLVLRMEKVTFSRI